MAIGQAAHAWLAGQVAAAWRAVPAPDVVLAITQHDAPWTDVDREPVLNAEHRRAAAFFELDRGVRLDMWRGVAGRVVEQDPYAALLVSMHAVNIHTRYAASGHGPPDGFVEEQVRDQDAILRALADTGANRGQAVRDSDLLFLIDAISLTICNASTAELIAADGTALRVDARNPSHVVLAPWPLAVAELDVHVHGRRFSERFDDEVALRAAFEAAPFERFGWRLAPGGSSRVVRQ